MLTPLRPFELVHSIDGLLRKVATSAMKDADPFERAQVLSAASLANYLSAELKQSRATESYARDTAVKALTKGSETVERAHPETAAELADAAVRAAGDGPDDVGDALATSLAALRSTGSDPDALEARRTLRLALADIVEREADVFASAETDPASKKPPDTRDQEETP